MSRNSFKVLSDRDIARPGATERVEAERQNLLALLARHREATDRD